MRFYARQKLFSLRTVFKILNEKGQPSYSAKGEIVSFGKRLHIYDRTGREVAVLRQRLMSLMPTYEIHIGGRYAASIVKRITLFKPSYSIKGSGWRVQGDFLKHSYRLIGPNGKVAASIRKRWFSFGDAFELNVPDPENELMAICVMLAIDCVMDNEEAAASRPSSSSVSSGKTSVADSVTGNDTES